MLAKLFRRHEKTSSSANASGSSEQSSSTTNTRHSSDPDDPKGPLGLSTLYSPSEAIVDLVFVHGLGGGSRKTWSKTGTGADYWPKEWLSEDPAFHNVRIHTFGYDSDWIRGKNACPNIHHFGRALLSDLSTSPDISTADTKIVLVGHSMGGLVIKQAYMNGRQNPSLEGLVKRFHTIFFLGTPHRGSDAAKVMNNILLSAYASSPLLAELQAASAVTQSINKNFEQYAAEMELWSFYETRKLKIGFLSKLIVSPDSAILGYDDEIERKIPANADHRSICKFESPKDSTYVSLRNALATTVVAITNFARESMARQRRHQLTNLRTYLGISRNLDDDLQNAKDTHISGTCQWFLKKPYYLEWKSFSPGTAPILWVNANPGAGKTVLASHVVGRLQEAKENCCYYFFKRGDEVKSKLSTCLRYLAFQLACINVQIRETLLRMQKNNIRLDDGENRALWDEVFLLIPSQQPHQRYFLVIDGLDACPDFSPSLQAMFSQLNQTSPWRILITSRRNVEIWKLFTDSGLIHCRAETISKLDTVHDLWRLISERVQTLGAAKDAKFRVGLREKILSNSDGCFLWVSSVLHEISTSYGEKEIDQILGDTPRGMKLLYQEILESMTNTSGGKSLAKAILAWVTCGTRIFSIHELEWALRHEVKGGTLDLQRSIASLCGQLIEVDQFDMVQLVHKTTQSFLFDDDLESEFAVSQKDAHTHIAKACLLCLTSEDMKPPRTGSRFALPRKFSPFSDYACEALPCHLAWVDPLASDVLALVSKFTKSHILSWIEEVSRRKKLDLLVDLAKSINSCLMQPSSSGKEVQSIRGWTSDLVRIAARFANVLAFWPSAIYSLIPPFCPVESIIISAAPTTKKIFVVGSSRPQWEDRLLCIDFPEGRVQAVCYGDEYIGIGFSSGTVLLDHAASCQEYKLLQHGEQVRILCFRNNSNILASCGPKFIRIWNTDTGEALHTLQSPYNPLCLEFDGGNLLVASYRNLLTSWDLEHPKASPIKKRWYALGDKPAPRSCPCAVSISVGHKMLAAAYVRQPITLWDLEGSAYYGSCGMKCADGETDTFMVTGLIFNPNPELNLLAVSYHHGYLAVLDPFQDETLARIHAPTHTIASSQDGRFLAASAGSGIIQIYDFRTLNLIYQVKSPDRFIQQLAFSKDSLRLVDIRHTQCTVWEPSALLGNFQTDQTNEAPTIVVKAPEMDTKVKVTAVTVNPKGTLVLCGKDDGSVSIYRIETGKEHLKLYRHRSKVCELVWWSTKDVITSVDRSNRIIVCRLKMLPTGRLESNGHTLQFRKQLDSQEIVLQVLPGEASSKMIFSTLSTDYLWTLDGQQESIRMRFDEPGIRKWIQHPTSPQHIICVEKSAVRLHDWKDLSAITSIPIEPLEPDLRLKNVSSYYISGGRFRILLEISHIYASMRTHSLRLLDADALSSLNNIPRPITVSKIDEPEEAAPTLPSLGNAHLASLSRLTTHVIGLINKSTLIFLDNESWVCSVDLEGLNEKSTLYTRHFFVPYDWFSGMRDIIGGIAQQKVILARNDEIGIIKGGLEFSRPVKLKDEL